MSTFNSPAPVHVLRNHARSVKFVDFDVKNPEHIAAYVCLTQYGRQHPTLRFNLIDRYVDVHSMMNALIGAEYAAQFPTADTTAQTALNLNKQVA